MTVADSEDRPLLRAVHLPFLSCCCSALLFAVLYWQLPVEAGSARDRLNSASNLIDGKCSGSLFVFFRSLKSSCRTAVCFIEPSWGQAYLDQRPRLKRDVTAGVVSTRAHTTVWFLLTLMRSVLVSVPVMTIGWFSVGYDVDAWSYALSFHVMYMTVMTLHSMILFFTLSAPTVDEAMGHMGLFYLFWWQFRGFFVKPSAYNPLLRWVLEINPSRVAFEFLSTKFLANTSFPCAHEQPNATNVTARGATLERLCPLPGDVILMRNELEDRTLHDVLLGAAWIAFIFALFHWKSQGWRTATETTQMIPAEGSGDPKSPLQNAGDDLAAGKQTEEGVPPTPTDASPGVSPTTSPAPTGVDIKVTVADAGEPLDSARSRAVRSFSDDAAQGIDDFMHEPVRLAFRDLCMSSETRAVLHGVSGAVSPGELLAILGPSGAGKTSLLKGFAGFSGLGVAGTIAVNGQSVSDGLLQNRLAAYVGQTDLFHEDLTVQETLFYAAELQLSHASAAVRKSRVADVLHGLHLDHLGDTLVSLLSGGERRRVSVGANGLLTPSRTILLDE